MCEVSNYIATEIELLADDGRILPFQIIVLITTIYLFSPPTQRRHLALGFRYRVHCGIGQYKCCSLGEMERDEHQNWIKIYNSTMCVLLKTSRNVDTSISLFTPSMVFILVLMNFQSFFSFFAMTCNKIS